MFPASPLQIGIDAKHVRLPPSATQHEVRTRPVGSDQPSAAALTASCFLQVLRSVMSVNENLSVHGLIVQLPLDSVNHIDATLVTNAVSPEKDVDGSVGPKRLRRLWAPVPSGVTLNPGLVLGVHPHVL